MSNYIMRRVWRKLKGNPMALARLVVVVICLSAGVVAAILLHASPAVIVGSFLGAALSLTVTWLVQVLGEQDQGLAPTELLTAAKSDIISVGYHRRNQSLTVSFLSERNIIKLDLEATLVPLNSEARIYRPKITAPPGVRLIDSKYFVNGAELLPSNADYIPFTTINKVSIDKCEVLYELADETKAVIKDQHLWPCPVLDYTVNFKTSEVFRFDVAKIMPGDEFKSLGNKIVNNRNTTITYIGDGAAFTRQGVEWRLIRIKESG